MESFIDRMRVEFNENVVRLNKLQEFIAEPKVSDVEGQVLLHLQEHYMEAYLEVLRERIDKYVDMFTDPK